MEKIMVSMPEQLAAKMRASIPRRQRSEVIVKLIKDELARRDDDLYKCALAVEEDEELNREMQEWDITVGDGIDNGAR